MDSGELNKTINNNLLVNSNIIVNNENLATNKLDSGGSKDNSLTLNNNTKLLVSTLPFEACVKSLSASNFTSHVNHVVHERLAKIQIKEARK